MVVAPSRADGSVVGGLVVAGVFAAGSFVDASVAVPAVDDGAAVAVPPVDDGSVIDGFRGAAVDAVEAPAAGIPSDGPEASAEGGSRRGGTTVGGGTGQLVHGLRSGTFSTRPTRSRFDDSPLALLMAVTLDP